ncbi:MBL fold metallo-hydrolase [Halalkalibacter okhensis]|uniref:Metallo-beta-lactamase family protein n=1 Tax=Halalkalibacter okhensis TaxID=333138 RepID=A0A0B0IJM7_9BACI|nr:MBL fold metallo-hydrolase [Halalkalibacter okhensis]KHF40259.1 metallo-beta-lactamase family protein [Halalkalibacter okhensis]
MEQQMHYSEDNKFIPITSVTNGVIQEVAPQVYCLPVQVVNVCFVGNPAKENEWVLVDAGMPKSADNILNALKEKFGSVHTPRAIVLTHGHFDHVGAIVELAEKWDVPIYAHSAEFPYLTGEKSYPEPDTSVEGGLIAKMSSFFPNGPTQLGRRLKELPKDHRIPEMPGWRWIHTPGHTPGHCSFIRIEDNTLIAGDAFVTVKQDSLYKVLTQEKEINGPPRYLTTDWEAAWESVGILKHLEPTVAVTGHGLPMYGEELTQSLDNLAANFDKLAIPDYGRFVDPNIN